MHLSGTYSGARVSLQGCAPRRRTSAGRVDRRVTRDQRRLRSVTSSAVGTTAAPYIFNTALKSKNHTPSHQTPVLRLSLCNFFTPYYLFAESNSKGALCKRSGYSHYSTFSSVRSSGAFSACARTVFPWASTSRFTKA